MSATARKYDINGWFEIKDNPLSKVGVYQYSGAMVDSTGAFDLAPGDVFNVYRPAEELSSQECIDSFKLVPWVDGHTMMGDEKEGFTPAEKKGISGIIGESVFFDPSDETLKGNVKVFAEDLKTQIEEGKRELSLGYRCRYEKQTGTYKGQHYDFVQTNIRGNHVASVDEGRMGPEVAVLDSSNLTFTIDSKELTMAKSIEQMLTDLTKTVIAMDEKIQSIEKKATDAEEAEKVKKAEDEEAEKVKKGEDVGGASAAASEKASKQKAEDAEESEKAKKEKAGYDAMNPEEKKAYDEENDPDKKKGEGMDAIRQENATLRKQLVALTSTVDEMGKTGLKIVLKTIAQRDVLAKALSDFTGTFAFDEMTLDDVAVYGVKKLELNCAPGSELAAVNGYLHDRVPAASGTGMDAADSTDVDTYCNTEV